MKYACALVTIGIVAVLLSSTSTPVFSSTPENNTVLQRAQNALEANQKRLAAVSPEPVANVIPSTFQEIKGTSIMQGCFLLGL